MLIDHCKYGNTWLAVFLAWYHVASVVHIDYKKNNGVNWSEDHLECAL